MTKKAFVTGGSMGIGRGIVKKLAESGYDVAFSYLNEVETAEKIKQDIEAIPGRKCYIFQASLEKPDVSHKLFEEAVAALGGLDLMVNNAGSSARENTFDLTEESIDFLINLEFRTYILMIRDAARYMAQHDTHGSIINISSSRAERAYPADCIYEGLKAALNTTMHSMALDLAPYGIRINNIAPGAIRNRTDEELAAATDERSKKFIETDFWNRLGKKIPLGRYGLPEDIAEAVLFLSSDKASYITGEVLRIDGGLILPGMPEWPDDDQEGGRGWGFVRPKTL